MAAMAAMAAAATAATPHLSVMTFYGMDLELQKGWTNVYRGEIADCSNPNITVNAAMKVLVSLPPGIFTRSSGIPRNGLYLDWETAVSTFTRQLKPLLRTGTAMGVFMGDEIVCSGTSLSNLSAVADLLRNELGPEAWIYTNECSEMERWPSLDPSAPGGGGVPASLSAISVDFYDEKNTDGAAEVAKNKEFYHSVIFPRLHPHQQVLFVPGIFASSPEGCVSKNVSCPLSQQAVQIVKKLDGFFEWAKTEPRVVGFNPWHFRNRSTNQFPLPYDQKLGAVSMPSVVAKLVEIGKYIINSKEAASQPPCPAHQTDCSDEVCPCAPKFPPNGNCTPFCDPHSRENVWKPGGKQPNVLLLGDSIAAAGTGYYTDVARLLNDTATVSNPRMYPQGGDFCGASWGVVGCIDVALDGKLWNVIHFNWGLHDVGVHSCCPNNASVGYAPITEEEYITNIETVYNKLRNALTPNGTLIFATTTPVPPSYTGRNNTSVITVNRLARTLFGPGSKHPSVLVHDLYSEVVGRCREEYPQANGYPTHSDCPLQPNGVHFCIPGKCTATGDKCIAPACIDSPGKEMTARFVVDAIRPHLR